MKVSACRQEDDFQASRPWYEPPYVIYGFSNPRVKNRIERLMGTYIVRATDRDFMVKMQMRIREDHQDMVKKKIHDRELQEVEREKQLILEGKTAMEEAPKELSDHPVFRITQLANKIIEERRLKELAKKRPKKIKMFNYELLEGKEEIDDEDWETRSCVYEHDITETERDIQLKKKEDYFAEGQGFTEDDYFRIKYADPLVEELREVETVDEIYEIADEIVGLLTGKTCGGLFKPETF